MIGNQMDRDGLPGQTIEYIPISVEGVAIYGKGYSQVLEVSLKPGVLLSTQPGRMMHYDEALQMDVDTGGLGGAARRVAAGEHPVRLNFFNPTSQPRTVALANNTPGVVIPVDLSQSQGFVFRKGSFLAAFGLEWRIGLKRAPSVGVACCSGMGLILSEIKGNGIAFIVGCGSVVEKYLQPGERFQVNVDSVVGFDSSLQHVVTQFGASCTTCMCAGQGMFASEFTGPGRLYIQSMPIERLRRMMARKQNNGDGGNGGDGGGGD
ncbi:hypothetical protein BASA81_005596 [Batrachochytrium salamandrivorans]|nr:hypothetical protein BASA81_005596 [Batrachochytrium salamandrivorans]